MPPANPRTATLCARCDFQHCAPTTVTSSSTSPASPLPAPTPPLPPIANVPPTTASTGPADVVNDLVYQADLFVGVAGATFADVYGAHRRAQEAAAASEAARAALRREVEGLSRENQGLRWVLGRKEERIEELEGVGKRVERLMRALLEEAEGREEAERMVEKMAEVVGVEVQGREGAEGRVAELEREVEGLRERVEAFEWRHQELKGDFMRV